MKVLVTGASGLLGTAVVSALIRGGNEVIRLVRRPVRSPDEIRWQPNGEANPSMFDGADAVIHLAGENIASGRWTARRKAAIRDSRVLGTRTVARSIAGAANPPKVLVSASAIGYYGDRGDELLTEQSPPGSGFLAEVCRAWEAQAEPASHAGARLVVIRTGLVLSTKGGALARMLPPFRLGLGGRIGAGRQWWSWIALPDQVGLTIFALNNSQLRGPVNAVAPNPVTNSQFTRALGKALHRPAWFPLPQFAVRLALGEMGEELLLASQRVQPAAALAAGFSFRYPQLQPALEHLLAR